MKKTLIAAAVMATSGIAFAASNVTLYGVIEEGVLLEKAKHADTTVQLRSGFDQGSRWGIKGVEDLGNGYSVGFILEQGFSADDGNVANAGNGTTSGFTREAFMYVNGDFGKFGAGRTGTLASGAQSNHILTGWALSEQALVFLLGQALLVQALAVPTTPSFMQLLSSQVSAYMLCTLTVLPLILTSGPITATIMA